MGAMSEIPRVCATCKHFTFTEGQSAYSEWTPATDCSFSCDKGYWYVTGGGCTEDEFRSSMIAATICLDYEEVAVHRPALKPTFPLDTAGVLASLVTQYPDFRIGITVNFPHRAWYERGNVGMTTSGSFVSAAQAYDWLVTRLAEMTRED